MDDLTRLSTVNPNEKTVLSNSEAATILSPLSGSGIPPGDGLHLEDGQTFGPYTIRRLLGKGGMGEVYEADHADTGRRVAIKLLRSRMHDREDRERFLREGRLAASISHPHTVYVFGSEEVTGMPVISMQLLPGGTLKDRVVERGPMPPPEAVAAILDVISGLHAAEAAGILHRDVKPSNCFVDDDGGVKVGDFGLSISTNVRGSEAGGFQGTPQYAPPEQLRGDALDVRADIYAVGATLFYLLTGRAPFEAKDFQSLVEQVKTAAPPQPRRVRPGIPKKLSAVVVKCLAKDPSDRPASYAELTRLLQPFTNAGVPARRSVRLVAGALDWCVIAVLAPLIQAVDVLPRAADASGKVDADPWAWTAAVAYSAIFERMWNATPGKRIVGLRVISSAGPLSWRQAIGRAVIFNGPALPMLLVAMWFGGRAVAAYLTANPAAASVVALVPMLLSVSLFLTMTRRNGMAAVHDLITGTRVVQRGAARLRSGAAAEVSSFVADPTEGQPRFGEYRPGPDLGAVPGGRLREGFDPILHRRVWLIELAAGAADVGRARRDVARPGRLHWLAARRSPEQNWDAFEAPSGGPVDLSPASAPWTSVRGWLNDLAAEIAAGERDGTLPPLSLDRVWIRHDGRALLLDFPAPGASPTPERSEARSPAQLLAAVGGLAIGRDASSPMPVTAVAMLDRWRKKPALTIAALQADLAGASLSADTVSRGRRLIPVLATAAPVVLMCSVTLIAIRQVDRLSPQDARLLELLEAVSEEKDATKRQALETYLAGTRRAALVDRAAWERLREFNDTDIAELKQVADRIVALEPAPEDVTAATAVVLPRVQKIEERFPEATPESRADRNREIVLALLLVGCGMSFFGGLTSVLARPSGLVLSALGLAVLTRSGREIGRLRALWRLLIAWLPMAIFSALLAWPSSRALMETTGTTLPLAALATLLLFAGVVWTIVRPLRGPHDIVAGTSIGVR
ncbi:MAG TPA: protein kinase [Vicinamibacterales bacterium]|nr:protein kinase [Vicinamibacterales bacterium]